LSFFAEYSRWRHSRNDADGGLGVSGTPHARRVNSYAISPTPKRPEPQSRERVISVSGIMFAAI
jgi:hypothetical protein